MLTPGERSLLFRTCWDHDVAYCDACDRWFKNERLASDLFRGLTHLCPSCRRDVSASIRDHLLSCAAALLVEAQETRAQAEMTSELSAELRKESQQLLDAIERRNAETEARTRDKTAGAPPTSE